nr:retrotransposon Gag protein [Tanacetum cinerariifolium]GFA03137.1 retrotransposon Gag protein [Tanacetum cinerariifolium]
MGDSIQLFQQQFEAFMKRYNEDQHRIQSQFEEIRRENSNNSATHEPRVNRRNEEGPDRGGERTGAQTVACKLDFPRYDGSTDPLPWISRCDYYFRHQRVMDEDKMNREEFKDHCRRRFSSYGSRSKLGELVKLRQTGSVEEYQRQFENLAVRTCHLRPEQVEIFISGLQERLYEQRRSKNQLKQ